MSTEEDVVLCWWNFQLGQVRKGLEQIVRNMDVFDVRALFDEGCEIYQSQFVMR